jgi:hypothetical protein
MTDRTMPMTFNALRTVWRIVMMLRTPAAFQWGGDGTDTDACANDVPDWLYETTGRQPVACKPKCPASCYASKLTSYVAQPTPTHAGDEPYNTDDATTTDDYSPYSTDTSTTDTSDYTTTEPDEAYTTPHMPTPHYSPYEDTSTTDPENTSTTDPSDYTTTEPEEASATPDMPTTDYPDATTTPSATTFVTSTKTAEPEPGYNGGSPPDADSTGDTLDNVCPKQCNPSDPLQNKCDITTSCTTTGNNKYFCACRAGFRSSAWNEKDFSKQFKFDGQPYVYTAEGVVCDQVCSDQTCSEVIARPQCQ